MSILKRGLFFFFLLKGLWWTLVFGSCTKWVAHTTSENKAITPHSIEENQPEVAAKNQVVNLAIWGSYLTDEMIKEFETTSGIKLKLTNYTSNEELLAKVQMGGSGIDVAVPSDYMVQVLRNSNMLEPLKLEQITNHALIDPIYLKQPYDPENRYSIPYAWSTAGIVINRSLYKDPVHSWKDLYENPKLAGKLSLLDDPREVTASVLKMLGYSANSVIESELKKAKEVLLKTKKGVKLFTSYPVDSLINKEVIAAQAYSTDANQAAARSKDKLEYIIPDEGGTRAIDNLVIIKGSKNIFQAHKLINFLLSEKANVNFVTHLRAGPVLKKTKSLLSKELQNNPALFPKNSVLQKLESLQDLGEKNRLYEEIWTEIKTN